MTVDPTTSAAAMEAEGDADGKYQFWKGYFDLLISCGGVKPQEADALADTCVEIVMAKRAAIFGTKTPVTGAST